MPIGESSVRLDLKASLVREAQITIALQYPDTSTSPSHVERVADAGGSLIGIRVPSARLLGQVGLQKGVRVLLSARTVEQSRGRSDRPHEDKHGSDPVQRVLELEGHSA